MSLYLPEEEVSRLCDLRDQRRKIDDEIGAILAKGINKKEDEEPAQASRKEKELTFKERDSSVKHVVGTWWTMDGGTDWQACFKPKMPVSMDGRIGNWLRSEFGQYGFTSNNGGQITLFVPKGQKFGPAIGKVAWAFYTLLKEEGKI